MMISLRSKVIQKVLRYFFLNEDADIYLSELAGIIGEDVANVHKILVKLEKEGLLNSSYRGKERFFLLNRRYPLLSAYREIFSQKFGLPELLKSILRNIKGISKAFIYGSFVDGQFDEFSDIDIVIIGSITRKFILSKFTKLEKELGRELNFILYTSEEYHQEQEKDPFLKNILSNKTIDLV
ncbi:nucleotidyltransferase domain-containing protein [Candidatus Dependentiae bacterium]|nr:nucleotidyltransferase domain-containing protein [Candidatus Dependentiae bacterium]